MYYLVAVGVARAPHDDENIADSCDSGKQPHAQPQHQVTHQILTRAELVRRRQAETRVPRQAAEPELVRHSTHGYSHQQCRILGYNYPYTVQ